MMETEGKSHRVFKVAERDFVLQWGNRKRLRCVKVRGDDVPSKGQKRTTSRVNRRVVNFDNDSSSPNPLLREWDLWGSESRKSSQPSSPDKEENRFYSTRGSSAAAIGSGGADDNRNAKGSTNGNAGCGGIDKGRIVLPRFFISLSSKEKEEDFMAMKGCKLPQRPKKRAKLIQKTILLVSPGAWLSDLSQERYEVREKKSSRKRKRGLKAMSMESDSE